MVSGVLYPCMFCVGMLMYLFVLCVACLTVFVNCLVKQFAICLGVVAILLLNVMDVFSVCGGALLDRPCRVFHIMCVCCACDPSERLDAPSIYFVCVFVCLSLRTGSQVFALHMLFLCVILHTMSSGKDCLLYFPWWMIQRCDKRSLYRDKVPDIAQNECSGDPRPVASRSHCVDDQYLASYLSL